MQGVRGGSVSTKVSLKQGSYQRGAAVIATVTIFVTAFVLIFGIQALQRI